MSSEGRLHDVRSLEGSGGTWTDSCALKPGIAVARWIERASNVTHERINCLNVRLDSDMKSVTEKKPQQEEQLTLSLKTRHNE